MGRAWRWRKCPCCGIVERASGFTPRRLFGGWGAGEATRVCPRCAWEAPTRDFMVIRERHAASTAVSGLP